MEHLFENSFVLRKHFKGTRIVGICGWFRGVFKTQLNIYDEDFLRKQLKAKNRSLLP